VTDVSGALGRGGYEGIQDDGDGNIWIVEDVGGSTKEGTTAKRPNSFLYRYVPAKPGDLQHGRLQALQVLNEGGEPIYLRQPGGARQPRPAGAPHLRQLVQNPLGDDPRHGGRWQRAVRRHRPRQAAGATPFMRPENGLFQPGSKFTKFFFDETGDTNATSPENGAAGGWGSIMELSQKSPSAGTGTLSMLYLADEAHSGLDNVAFLSRDAITFCEDAGDTLHAQRNALDSAYVWNVEADYSTGLEPTRWLAEGRDPSATLDAAFGGFGNEGDNEITGLHVSDGDPGVGGVLGTKVPEFDSSQWRWFYTQQHGDNRTYEVVVKDRRDG
jgi:hypothetical protein